MSQQKRKIDGPPVRELRRVDQEPVKVPPHKKPRKYRMTVKYVRTITSTYVKEFPSKEAMREHRARVDRVIAAERAGTHRYWSLTYDMKMSCSDSCEFKEGPFITEEMIEGQG